MIKLEYPRFKELRQAHIDDDRELIEVEERKHREWLHYQLDALGVSTSQAEVELEAVRDIPTLTAQYKQACSNYKDIMLLVERSRQLKKDLRHAMTRRKANGLQ